VSKFEKRERERHGTHKRSRTVVYADVEVHPVERASKMTEVSRRPSPVPPKSVRRQRRDTRQVNGR